MPTPLVPGVYIDEESRRPDAIAGLPTAITLFVGATSSGPFDVAVKVTSRAGYATAFGASDDLAQSVAHYFANGGAVAWILSPNVAGGAGPGSTAFHDALLACFADGGPVDAIDRFDLLCVPGEADPATQAALQAQCAARRAFYIADCAADATVATLAAGPDPLVLGPDASHAALYAPWVVPTGGDRSFPPSGFVAGIYARIDAARGVWHAPAGADATLSGAGTLAVPIDARFGDTLNDAEINGLRARPDGSLVVWGARTLGGDASCRYVPVRRSLLFVESSLAEGLAWTVFEPNVESLWARVRQLVSDFLANLWRAGAFAGTKPEQSWFVQCDRSTMAQADLDAGRLIVEVGVAPLRPAEFLVIRLVFPTQQ